MKKTNLFPLIMKCTAVLSTAMTVLFWCLAAHWPQKWFLPAAITFGTICFHFSMRLFIGLIIPKLFARVNPMHSWFQPKAFESRLYRVLGIRRWKQYVPTYAPETFSMDLPLDQIARTMCISELVHECIVLFSFIPLLFAIPFGKFPVFLITSVIAAMVDCIFILLQRYNRPRVLRVLTKKLLASRPCGIA